MSEKPDPRTRLVADTLGDDWTTGPASGYAVKAASHARRRRAARRGIVAAAGATMAALAIVVATSIRQRGTSIDPGPEKSVGAAQIATVTPEKKPPAYEIISDAELMVALADRSVLILPQVQGGPKIVVLDR